MDLPTADKEQNAAFIVSDLTVLFFSRTESKFETVVRGDREMNAL